MCRREASHRVQLVLQALELTALIPYELLKALARGCLEHGDEKLPIKTSPENVPLLGPLLPFEEPKSIRVVEGVDKEIDVGVGEARHCHL